MQRKLILGGAALVCTGAAYFVTIRSFGTPDSEEPVETEVPIEVVERLHPALRVVDLYLSSTHGLPPVLVPSEGHEKSSVDDRQAFQATLRSDRLNATWKCLQSTGDLDTEIDGTQDDPLSYTLTLESASEELATVKVTERFGEDKVVSVTVEQKADTWLIASTSEFDPATIDCPLELPTPE